jgi:patatin-related protein
MPPSGHAGEGTAAGLICYGGISLAVYMHGITKEVWRLVRASRAFAERGEPADPAEAVYQDLLRAIEAATGTRLRVLVDIITGASAGGINGVFLAQAIASGQSLEPLTSLWLEGADVDRLIEPDPAPGRNGPASGRGRSRAGRRDDRTRRKTGLDPAVRREVHAKLTRFLKARWLAPPFGGERFTALLLDALDAMAATGDGRPLLPAGSRSTCSSPVTDFRGHPERLRLHSPEEIVETEHRLTLAFSDRGSSPRSIGDAAELAFASRATASFPGAFPPFGWPSSTACWRAAAAPGRGATGSWRASCRDGRRSGQRRRRC